MKIQLAVLFGGNSVEHEISIISAIQAINHLDKNKYDIIPVYITKSNEMFTGEQVATIAAYKNIPALLKSSTPVAFVNEGGKSFMILEPLAKGFKRKKRQIDIAFPIVHGYNAEDGTLQGYLHTLGLPFVGCDVISSAAGMEKHFMKTILRDAGIPVLDCLAFTRFDYNAAPEKIITQLKENFSFPMIVKPATLGSSIGISKATDEQELYEALELAFSYATKVLVEPAVVALREINCSVVGDIEEAEASECEEPLNATTILSFEDKYMSGGKNGSKSGGAKDSDSVGMASLSRKIPADIPDSLRSEIRRTAVRAFQALGCNGVARIDFLLDVKNDAFFVNEINTIPGSLSFYLWEPLGIPYSKLLDRMIQLALKRERDEKGLLKSFDSNVLSLASDSALGGAKIIK